MLPRVCHGCDAWYFDGSGDMNTRRVLVWAGVGLAAVAAVGVASQFVHTGVDAVPSGDPSSVMVIAGEDQDVDQQALSNAKSIEDLKNVKGLEMGGSNSNEKPAPSEPPR